MRAKNAKVVTPVRERRSGSRAALMQVSLVSADGSQTAMGYMTRLYRDYVVVEYGSLREHFSRAAGESLATGSVWRLSAESMERMPPAVEKTKNPKQNAEKARREYRRVVEARLRGTPVRDIAARMGVSREWVYREIRAHGDQERLRLRGFAQPDQAAAKPRRERKKR